MRDSAELDWKYSMNALIVSYIRLFEQAKIVPRTIDRYYTIVRIHPK